MKGGLAMALGFVVVGLALIGRTLQVGVGGGLGIMLGALLVLAGCLRIYRLRR